MVKDLLYSQQSEITAEQMEFASEIPEQNASAENFAENLKAKSIAPIPALGSIDAYINWVNQIPILTSEEEFILAERFHQQGDLEAARRLVLAHLRFVVHIAKGYLGYGLAKADLIQEGTIGLMKAVKRFDPYQGVRLVSFAVHWIKAEIHEFVLRNWRIVKIATTKAQRKLFFNLRRATKQLNWFSNAEITKIAQELQVDPKEIRTMEARMQQSDVALEMHGEDAEQDYHAPINQLISDEPGPFEQSAGLEDEQHRLAGLTHGLAKLDPRSREIVEQRWLQEKRVTLRTLATKYQISAERVRQLEEAALSKLREELNSAAGCA